MKKFAKGFTLIELLIVIALLGALAVALLAALDPLEQIKKGTDTGVRNTVAEIAGAIVRYQSVKSGSMPFATGAILDWQAVGTNSTGPAYTVIQNIIDTGELKTDFFALAQSQLDQIYIIADQSRSYVCFAPGAKSFKADANTKFVPPAAGGTIATMTEATCINGMSSTATDATPCYWCVR